MIQCKYCGHIGGYHSLSCHRPVSVADADSRVLPSGSGHTS